MNAVAVLSEVTHDPLKAALAVACRNLQARKADLEQAQQELIRHQETRARKQASLESAISAEADNDDVEEAARLGQEGRAIEDQLKVVGRLEASAAAKVERGRAEVNDAQMDVERALKPISLRECAQLVAQGINALQPAILAYEKLLSYPGFVAGAIDDTRTSAEDLRNFAQSPARRFLLMMHKVTARNLEDELTTSIAAPLKQSNNWYSLRRMELLDEASKFSNEESANENA